jgi:DNA-binding CsgD family transcriptional regulator
MADLRRREQIAAAVCTQAELDVLALDATGMSQWQMALQLGISRRAVRDRLDNAHRKILNQEEKTA